MKTQSRKKRKKRVRQAKIKRGVKHFSKALLHLLAKAHPFLSSSKDGGLPGIPNSLLGFILGVDLINIFV